VSDLVTLESVAREAALELYGPHDAFAELPFVAPGEGVEMRYHAGTQFLDVPDLGARLRSRGEAVILRALERALACCPVPAEVADERLAEIRRLEAAATAGPWVAFGDDTSFAGRIYSVAETPDGGRFTQITDTPPYDDRAADMAFIADARRAVPELLAHVGHLHRVVRGTEADAYAQGYDAGLREGAMRRQWWSDRLADAALGVVLALAAAFGCLALYLLVALGKILAGLF
jgi:hypothetical protein